MRTDARTLLMAGVALLACAVTGCSRPGTSTQNSRPVVLAEAQGICPFHIVYMRTPDACQLTHSWNGTTRLFSTPRRLWGVAYAFNCGSRPQQFSFNERLTAMDHMAILGTYTRAKRGSGYVMISKRRMTDLIKVVPQQFKADDAYMEVDVASPCTWHVKAILGSRQDVASAVPPVPAMRPRWWEKKG